jgi:hypothetical protein
MAKISTYAIDATPTLADKVIGTDVNDSNITKNYTLGDIIDLVPAPIFPSPGAQMTNGFVPYWNGSSFVDTAMEIVPGLTPLTLVSSEPIEIGYIDPNNVINALQVKGTSLFSSSPTIDAKLIADGGTPAPTWAAGNGDIEGVSIKYDTISKGNIYIIDENETALSDVLSTIGGVNGTPVDRSNLESNIFTIGTTNNQTFRIGAGDGFGGARNNIISTSGNSTGIGTGAFVGYGGTSTQHTLMMGRNNTTLLNSLYSIIGGRSNYLGGNVNEGFVFGEGNSVGASSITQVPFVTREMNFDGAFVLGNQNIIRSEEMSGTVTSTSAAGIYCIGSRNQMRELDLDNYCLGFGNNLTKRVDDDTSFGSVRNSFMIGGDLEGENESMAFGYRNDPNEYPQKGANRGDVKIAIATTQITGNSRTNAFMITEDNGTGSNLRAQFYLPPLLTMNFVDDAAAVSGGILAGGLYHTDGVVKICRLSPPTLKTLEPDQVEQTQQRLRGQIYSSGEGTMGATGFYYGQSSNYLNNTKTQVTTTPPIGTLIMNVSATVGSTPNSLYYATFYTTSDGVEYVGATVQARTLANTTPLLTTSSVANNVAGDVTLRFLAQSDGNNTITECGFYYGKVDVYNDPSNEKIAIPNAPFAVGATTELGLTGLDPGVEYFCWGYAINSQGEYFDPNSDSWNQN